MTQMLTRAAGAAALFATALLPAAPASARVRREPPAATATGPALDCVPLTQIRNTRVYGDRTIDFEGRGGQVWRNVLPDPCPQLGFEERFSYATSPSQLCSVDIITVLLSPGLTRGASCGLGTFQPVRYADARDRRFAGQR